MKDYFVPSILTFQLIFEEGFKDGIHVVVFIVNQFGVYGPFLAAIITLLIFKRKEDLGEMFNQMTKFKVDLKWYGFMLLVPLIINLGSLGLAALLMADMSLAFNPGLSIPLIILMFFNNLLTSGFEEPGWRGFAVPELYKKFTAYKTSMIVGIIWAIWHYPYVFYLNYIEMEMGLFLTVLAMAGFTALITFGSVIYSWLYLNTKSVLLLIIFHAIQNVLPILIIGGVVDPIGGFSTALFTLIIVLIINKRYGEESLQGMTNETKKE